jgi:hypothetical protein
LLASFLSIVSRSEAAILRAMLRLSSLLACLSGRAAAKSSAWSRRRTSFVSCRVVSAGCARVASATVSDRCHSRSGSCARLPGRAACAGDAEQPLRVTAGPMVPAVRTAVPRTARVAASVAAGARPRRRQAARSHRRALTAVAEDCEAIMPRAEPLSGAALMKRYQLVLGRKGLAARIAAIRTSVIVSCSEIC